jgi:hypothetical protein
LTVFSRKLTGFRLCAQARKHPAVPNKSSQNYISEIAQFSRGLWFSYIWTGIQCPYKAGRYFTTTHSTIPLFGICSDAYVSTLHQCLYDNLCCFSKLIHEQILSTF